MHFPDDVTVRFARPQSELIAEHKATFPGSTAEIDGFFAALADATQSAKAIFTRRALSGLFADVYGLWHRRDVARWWRSSAEVVGSLIGDPPLRADLVAQQGDYGGMEPARTSFGMHAVVMSHYLNGAYYPVGGGRAFAQALVPVIEQRGGAVRLNARGQALRTEDGATMGVQLDDGTLLRAPAVFSDIGARNIVALLPAALRQTDWAKEILSFAPLVCHVTLYLGLIGDIRAHGATTANHWFHGSWDIDQGVWKPAAEDGPEPVLFISFPSLKDPSLAPGDHKRHTAEVVETVAWEPFSRWSGSTMQERPEAYKEFKAIIERSLLAQFARHFPQLAPMVAFH